MVLWLWSTFPGVEGKSNKILLYGGAAVTKYPRLGNLQRQVLAVTQAGLKLQGSSNHLVSAS